VLFVDLTDAVRAKGPGALAYRHEVLLVAMLLGGIVAMTSRSGSTRPMSTVRS
jgi:hypothetical protein